MKQFLTVLLAALGIAPVSAPRIDVQNMNLDKAFTGSQPADSQHTA